MIYNNTPMMNQLMRNKEQLDNLIQQYNQPTPIQNFINTIGAEFEAKILTNGEDVSNIMINRKTLFVDEKNHKVLVKELDGTISKEYEIIVPKDEKDLRIEELERKLQEMEVRLNEHDEYARAIDTSKQSNVNVDGNVKSQPKTSTKSV